LEAAEVTHPTSQTQAASGRLFSWEIDMPSEGVKSTEFWMFAVTGIAMLVNGTSLVNVPWDQFTIWMGATGLYAGARTWEKVVAHKNGKEKANA
jgi:hypothetical protein